MLPIKNQDKTLPDARELQITDDKPDTPPSAIRRKGIAAFIGATVDFSTKQRFHCPLV